MALYRLIILLLTCVLAAAQTPRPSNQNVPNQDTIFRVDVNLVQVDAVVTDSDDRPVTDLQPEDFIILQDGKPQEIVNFSYIRTMDLKARSVVKQKPAKLTGDRLPLPPPPTALLKRGQIRRTVALVVDDLALSFEGTVSVREALKKWVDTDMQPGDLVAVVLTGVGVGAMQQFTNDKRMLYAVIDSIQFTMGRVGATSFAPLQPVIPGSIDTTTFDEERNRALTMGSLGAIQYIVDGLKELPGRKSLILFSENITTFFRESNEGFIDFHRSQLVEERLRRLAQAANRSAVVIHAIDPRGVVYTGLTAEDNIAGRSPMDIAMVDSQRLQNLIDSQEGMVDLTQETGGLFIQGNNDLEGALRTVVEDGEGYYLLGYRPDAATAAEMESGESKYHRISVRVKRRGLHVRSRSGFFSTPDREIAPEKPTRKDRMLRTLYSPFATEDLHVQLTTLFFQNEQKKSSINALMYFDANGLTFSEEEEGWHETAIDIVAATFGADGQQVDFVERRLMLRVKDQTFENMMKNGIALYMNVPVKKPGAYQMRVVLCDIESEKLGSARRFIEVPDLDKGGLALSGIVLATDVLQPAAVFDQEGRVLAFEGSNGSAAVRLFELGSTIGWACQIFNAKTDKEHKPQLKLQIRLFSEGREVFSGERLLLNTEAIKDLKRMLASGRMHLKKAPPGPYAMQVIVLDMLAKEKHRMAAQTMDFEVQRMKEE